MKPRAWIVVPGSDRARIFKVQKPGVLIQVECLQDPLGRTKEHDLTSDMSGKRTGVFHSCHFMEMETSSHKKELIQFSKYISHYLEKALQEKKYENLYLGADPHLLGCLRPVLPAHLQSCIAGECSKNLSLESIEKIWDQLPFAI